MANAQNLKKLLYVVPCYNESEGLNQCADELLQSLNKMQAESLISPDSGIVFVDDGSQDDTWRKIQELAQKAPDKIVGLQLSRNFGHQNALLAAMSFAKNNSDCCITIDADLQHDIGVCPAMIKKHLEGSEIVLGIKKDRNDSFFKSFTAKIFYSLAKAFGTQIIPNHADFRLLGKKALNTLDQFGEYYVFLRGIIMELGFSVGKVYYDVKDRSSGDSKYTLKKMISLSLSGILSFSLVPLRLVSLLGLFVVAICIGVSTYVLVSYFKGQVVPGWTSTVLPIYFMGGAQLLSIGILGEYLGRTFIEVKKRPRYIINEQTTNG